MERNTINGREMMKTLKSSTVWNSTEELRTYCLLLIATVESQEKELEILTKKDTTATEIMKIQKEQIEKQENMIQRMQGALDTLKLYLEQMKKQKPSS